MGGWGGCDALPFSSLRDAQRVCLNQGRYILVVDPPAHWNPDYPAIDELPATFAVRPLVIIPIQDQVALDPNYHLNIFDTQDWERKHGRIPKGSVVFVRSDWSSSWPNPELATRTKFPGVKLEALQFLHLQRQILFHGHEPLDTPMAGGYAIALIYFLSTIRSTRKL